MKITAGIKNILKVFPQKRQLIFNGIDFYRNSYKNNSAPSEIKAAIFQNIIDEKIKEEDHTLVSCKKGCAFCCMIKVTITEDEANLIRLYCEKNKIEIDKSKLKLQANRDDLTYFKLDKSIKTCIFQSDKNECKIYPVRPLSCRKYHVVSNPINCNTYEDNNIGVVTNELIEVIVSGIFNATETGTIPEMLLK